ncbi:MAG: hypothetical protein RR969_10540, partial [Thermomonas sp.]
MSSSDSEVELRRAHLLLAHPVFVVHRLAGGRDHPVMERADFVEALAQVEAFVAEIAVRIFAAAGQFVVVFPQPRFAQGHAGHDQVKRGHADQQGARAPLHGDAERAAGNHRQPDQHRQCVAHAAPDAFRSHQRDQVEAAGRD